MVRGDRPLLSIENVSRSFPGVLALNNVTFAINAGEVHGLVGENGAGKSTLMAVASGALSPDEGTVTICGTRIGADPNQAKDCGLAMVRQEPSLMPDLTVADNLLLGVPRSRRPATRLSYHWAAKLLNHWSEDTGISVKDRVVALNPEQRFIVEIVKALAAEPNVLILDEPTEHLAGADVDRLFARIREVTARGAAVVYISHRLREVEAICDRITILRDGECEGTFHRGQLTEEQIVERIVGRSLDREFPAKNPDILSVTETFGIRGISGKGFTNVNVTLHRGEILGVAGIDGNGQREFVRALAGLHGYRGDIILDGVIQNLHGPRAAAAAGFRYLAGDRHREGIFADLSVRENFSFRSIEMDATLGLINARAETDRAMAAVKRVAVKTPSLETPIATLSGGNQQKLAFASVLATDPQVLLADEPTQGVDVGARMEIYKLLREAAAAGACVIVRSSDASEVAGLSDRVLIFSRGRVVRELVGDDVSESKIIGAALTTNSERERAHGRANSLWEWMAGDAAPLIMVAAAVLLLGAYAAYMNPFFLSARSLSGMLPLIATLALVSYGQQMLMLTGAIDLSVGPLIGLVVVTGSFFLNTGSPVELQLVGWVVLIALSALVGFLNWFLVDTIKLNPLIATLCSYMALQAISLHLRPTPGGLIDDTVLELIATPVGIVPVLFIFAIVVGIAAEFSLRKSRAGLVLAGYGSQPEAARVVGIRPRLVMLSAHVGCSLCAGLAAIAMIGQVAIGDAGAGVSYSLSSIAAAVIGGGSLFGGRGSFLGALFGSILIVEVGAVTGFLGSSDAWQSYLLGSMILVSVALYSKSRQKAVAA
jgi:ribose transport system ATP-binding protein